MGQASSRATPSSSSASPLPNSSASAPPLLDDALPNSVSSQTPTSEVETVPKKQSRRSKVYRSISNLVKPQYVRNRVDSVVSSSRRSWRNSKRYSKALPEFSQADEIHESLEAPSRPSSPIAEKTPDTERDYDLAQSATLQTAGDFIDTSSSSASTSQQPPQDSLPLDRTPAADANNGVTSDSAVFPHPTPEITEAVSTLDDSLPELSDLPNSPTDTAVPSTSQPNHGFPPPGTLVVVQGIVHTTDVPRDSQHPTSSESAASTPVSRRASSTFRPATPAGNDRASVSRNRLSALLRSRPSSMVASRPTEISEGEPMMSEAESTESSPISPDGPSDTVVEMEGDSSPNAPRPDARVSSISPSSIEVLGTLLSVAAAATAASLLTGSSEPLLSSSSSSPTSSSMAPPSTPSTPTDGDNPTVARPTSPTPTAGLGAPHDIGAAGRAERMRNAWGTIRERLGIRPNISSSRDGNSFTPHTTHGRDRTPADTRELMLAEMARAFNLGFGLSSEAMSPHSDSGDDGVPAEARQEGAEEAGGLGGMGIPTEGSFERFLIDLQADLRNTLLNEGMTGSEPPSYPLDEAATVSTPHDAVPSSLNQTNSTIHPGEATENASTDDRVNGPTFADTQSPPIVNDTDQEAETDNNAGRINWWRLYRFPPIQTPTTDASNSTVFPQSPQASQTGPGESAASQPTDSPPLPSSRPSTAATVIPVIVVGLQSVRTPGRDAAGASPEGSASQDNDMELPFSSDLAADQNGQLSEGSNPTRGRRWPSRAASALRNLRTGRRAGTSDVITATGLAQRTFLIYVIGGYYPPDHHIVTGGPNNLDSFEALLEIAELLGQVKPPTVSQEEINKSGLETITRMQLVAYEEQGKVASNCIDKCLICLDEYDEHESIRVLGCRHAFHTECVDKWLQVGKNNCPACRSKGVSTEQTSGREQPTSLSGTA